MEWQRRFLGAALVILACAAPLHGQGRRGSDLDRYDPIFRKYTKRFFGPAFDWRVFKAQGLAESGLDTSARSRAGARGIMQLMPSTFALLHPGAPDPGAIHDPERNIVAGLRHDRAMWVTWPQAATPLDRRQFMFASYNAGSVTIARAWRVARAHHLDPNRWANIERIAARVLRWRERQTLRYLRRIEAFLGLLNGKGRLRGRRR